MQGPNCNRRGWASPNSFWCWSQAATGLSEHLSHPPCQQASCNHAGKMSPLNSTSPVWKPDLSRARQEPWVLPSPRSSQATISPDWCWSSSHKWLNHIRDRQVTQTCPFYTTAEPQQGEQTSWILSPPGSSRGRVTAGEFTEPTQNMPIECLAPVARGDCTSGPHKTAPTWDQSFKSEGSTWLP